MSRASSSEKDCSHFFILSLAFGFALILSGCLVPTNSFQIDLSIQDDGRFEYRYQGTVNWVSEGMSLENLKSMIKKTKELQQEEEAAAQSMRRDSHVRKFESLGKHQYKTEFICEGKLEGPGTYILEPTALRIIVQKDRSIDVVTRNPSYALSAAESIPREYQGILQIKTNAKIGASNAESLQGDPRTSDWSILVWRIGTRKFGAVPMPDKLPFAILNSQVQVVSGGENKTNYACKDR